MQALYKFYEVVKVVSPKPTLSEINGQEAAILGMVQNDCGDWLYSVQMIESGEGWDVAENELKPTGRMMAREDFYGGDSVTVEVDPISGEGTIKK
ncbi:Imm31 family immunity protein [Hahella sp. SMD15-11]|uniref:Imm31 family immunity protein n=1 Tax=Thermohahella caldifontis TaxID=3142973 RepID=A0AB39UVS6_9GAMM